MDAKTGAIVGLLAPLSASILQSPSSDSLAVSDDFRGFESLKSQLWENRRLVLTQVIRNFLKPFGGALHRGPPSNTSSGYPCDLFHVRREENQPVNWVKRFHSRLGRTGSTKCLGRVLTMVLTWELDYSGMFDQVFDLSDTKALLFPQTL